MTLDRDFLYRITQQIIIEDTWVVDAVRFFICIFAWLTAALLAKLYFDHKTGRMNTFAAFGAVLTYVAVGYAQIVAIAAPYSPDGLSLLNLVVLVAVILSFFGSTKVMTINLFRRCQDDDEPS